MKLPVSFYKLFFLDALSVPAFFFFFSLRVVNLISFQELLFIYEVNNVHSVLISIQTQKVEEQ